VCLMGEEEEGVDQASVGRDCFQEREGELGGD